MVAYKVLFYLLGTAEVHSSMALFTNVAMEWLNGICLMCLMYTVYTLECVSFASMD